jgi:hypothetical protein
MHNQNRERATRKGGLWNQKKPKSGKQSTIEQRNSTRGSIDPVTRI